MCGRENGKRCTDVNCGVVPTLFGSFFEIPSLHASSFLKCFFVTCFCYFFGGGEGGKKCFFAEICWCKSDIRIVQ